MVNVALLRKTMDYIEAHPDEHDQSQWGVRTTCGTACCFAGHAVILAGWDLVFDIDNPGEVMRTFAACCRKDGDEGFIDDIATNELGLDDGVATTLFQPSNSAARLRCLVDAIIDGRPLT